jgi:hypothetical protein
MIHYQLRCEAAHAFDGWFRDSAGFEKLAASGLVECPHCASTKVTRALMAPAIPRKGKPAAAPPAPAPEPAPAEAPPGRAVAGPVPAELRAVLQRLRAEVEKNCDYVGPRFAEEARRIHEGESDARGIYGEATDEEARALHEDGIEFGRIPWVPPTDS